MSTVTVTTRAQILRHTTAFILGVLHQSELRRSLIAILHRDTPISNQVTLRQLNLAADALESAISVSSSVIRSSSLSLAEKLLLPLPEYPVSSFLLSLIRTLHNLPDESAISLLRIFHSNPTLARSEISPSLYERLFSIHLFPVFRWYDEQRTQILSSAFATSIPNAGDYSVSDESVVFPWAKSLSKMSGDQTSKLRELEREYEEVVDENCRILAVYFKEILVNKDEHVSVSPPTLILKRAAEGGDGGGESRKEEILMPVLENGRYNPMWSERDASVESMSGSSSGRSSHKALYPQRVSPKVFKPQKSSKYWTAARYLNSAAETQFSLDENLLCCSSDSEMENEEKDKNIALLEPRQSQTQEQIQNIFKESRGSPDYPMADYNNTPHGSEKQTPPKDFVCPITSNIFDDPVTLETGQTYERKAIEEWFNRGNLTCPITRHNLQNTQLPKTNYVLKRLVASWKERNPNSVLSPCESPYKDTEAVVVKTPTPSTSPNSVITQATVDGMISELRTAIDNLYMSEILEESETAVLQIEKLWRGGNLGVDIHSMLSKPPIINGFVEILFNSVDPQVLQATVFLLTEMGCRDNAVIQTLTRVDTDVECIMALFKKGLTEAVVLLYLLNPSTVTLKEMAVVESLITVFDKKEEDLVKMCLKPKTAAVLLLSQIIASSEDEIFSSSVISKILFSEKAIGVIVGCLGAEWAEERIAAVEILLRCMQEDGTCRNTIADKAELSPVLESFICATEGDRFKIVEFFSELVKLNRRTFIEQILHIIKEEGPFSTMHTLLIHLQTALQDQCPVTAGLLLQLDLLVEPRKMSIYREEAIETLISCLKNSDFPATQLAAANTIMSLHGSFNFLGKPLIREVLLKRAGIVRSPRSDVHADQISNFYTKTEATPEDEKALVDWERKIASVLVSQEFGILFEALADGMKSRIPELRSTCFISATWLVYMLTILPDTGIQGAARVCLLKQFVTKLNSAKDVDDRILSMLALKSFLHFSDGLGDLTASYTKDILKGLRELRRFSPLASEMLKVLVGENESKADIWTHKELIQVDCSENGQVLSVIYFKDKIFSGHTDGSIKVWKLKDNSLLLLQEIQEHTKAVTNLTISESGDRLYSGSLDRTAKIWSIGKEAIHCEQVHDMKDQIHNLVVTNSIACFIPQGTGVKVQSLNGESKLLNSNKYVKCLAHAHGRLYCGCHDNSVQEIHLATGTVSTIQSGFKRLLAKANPIYALQIHGELLYAAGSSLDGSAIKIWNNSNYSMVGSLQTGSEVRAMVVSSELIYLGCKGGAVEVWDKKKHNRVDMIQVGTNCKVNCVALGSNEEILVIGTSDGQLQAWGLN